MFSSLGVSNQEGLYTSSIMYPVYVLCAATLVYILYQRMLSPLAKVPGPFCASLSRLWLTWLSWKGDTHRVIVDLHNEHGDLVRIAPNEVSVADPAAIRKIYAHGTKFRKSDWYSVWQGRRKFDLFPERDERLHGKQRSLISRPYSMDALKDLETYVDDAIVQFFKHMEGIRDTSIDLGKWVQLFAFDVIGEITFSKRFGFMDVGEDDGSFKQIENALRSASWVGQVPWVYWIHDYLQPIIGNHLGITARHGTLRNFAMREVNSRKERGSDHVDILSRLFAVHEQKPDEFDENAVASMATSNIFAGSDTTAASMRAIIYYLLKNPEYKRKLIEEIDAKKKKDELSDPVSMKEAESMPYLQACIYEALRCHPATGMSLPRVVPEGGFETCGHFLPAGIVIGTNSWAIHNNKSVFGEDANKFSPDRWLKGETGDMQRFFFAFGQGARTCLGKNIGLMEMSKLIPTLFMRYNVELTDPDAEWTLRSWWFVLQRGVIVNLTPR